MSRVLLVGLDRPETDELRSNLTLPSIAHAVLPTIKLDHGQLLVERSGAAGQFLPATHVVYHGIFEDDFDFISALALWGGPCFPGATGMMRCRLRIPCLAESLRVTRFGSMRRGWVDRASVARVDRPSVAKWGNWHCGENKERFDSVWHATEPTVVEEFIEGQAVRLMLIGDRAWQIALTGETWRKSIHPDDSQFIAIRPDLLDDSRALAKHFGLQVCGVDYMISTGGTPHLLEVNHIPNVTRFGEVREAYLQLVAEWLRDWEPRE